uniref:Uncharacterized protein n=1 Tax=Rhizophora mucronata TaxID=61149 RepID=A0A2P2NS07_RHIMU
MSKFFYSIRIRQDLECNQNFCSFLLFFPTFWLVRFL